MGESRTARLKTRRFAILLTALLGALVAAAVCAAGPFVKDLSWRYQGKDIVVSLTVGEAVQQPELKEQIESTRPVSLTFTIEVVKKRSNWADKPLFRRVIMHTVLYDNLTRQYNLETTVNGKRTDQRTVATWDEMALYMESVKDVVAGTVADLDFDDGTYAVRGKVYVKTNFVMVIIPWDVQTAWESRSLTRP